MVLDPHIAAFIAAAEPVAFPAGVRFGTPDGEAYLVRQRAVVRPRSLHSVDVAHVSEARTPGGVPVRIYRPSLEPSPALLVYLHGGGWVLGDLEMHDATCRRLAASLGAVLINVEYRLAPEHPFPTPLDDALDATDWAIARAAEWCVDSARTFVAGTSAGGNLAAAVAIRRRDTGSAGPLSGQILIYPVLDSCMDTQSYRDKADGFFLTAEQMRFYWDAYWQRSGRCEHPWASPSHAEDLSGLPPALIVTAEHDPLRDEAENYARRLAASGSRAELVRVPGQIHGFLTAFPGRPEVESTFTLIVDAVRAETERVHP